MSGTFPVRQRTPYSQSTSPSFALNDPRLETTTVNGPSNLNSTRSISAKDSVPPHHSLSKKKNRGLSDNHHTGWNCHHAPLSTILNHTPFPLLPPPPESQYLQHICVHSHLHSHSHIYIYIYRTQVFPFRGLWRQNMTLFHAAEFFPSLLIHNGVAG